MSKRVLGVVATIVLAFATALHGQEAATDGGGQWIGLGLYTLGLRGGADLEQSGQALIGASLDVGHVYDERLRLRLVGELGFAPDPNTYVGSFELIYRFTPDSSVAIPYVGTGLGLAGSEQCGSDPGCPGVWWQFVLGFELRLNRQFNWLIEYHPQNALRRHRILVGLVMRRGDT
jgi:hypothetical protein